MRFKASIAIIITGMLDRLRKLSPAKRLKGLSISVVVVACLLFIATLTSLSLTASNLMITTELSTTSELQTLYSQHARTSTPTQSTSSLSE
jgi:hypothetical protein